MRRGRQRPVMGLPGPGATDDEDTVTADTEDEDSDEPPAPLHRTFFPETWLWSIEKMRSVCH